MQCIPSQKLGPIRCITKLRHSVKAFWQAHNYASTRDKSNLNSKGSYARRSLNLRHSIEANQTMSWLAPVSFCVLVCYPLGIVYVPFLQGPIVSFVLVPAHQNIADNFVRGWDLNRDNDHKNMKKRDVSPLWLVWFQRKKYVMYVPNLIEVYGNQP